MMISSLKYCMLLVCVYQTTFAARPGLLEGDGINFPRRTLSRTQAANCVFNKRLFAIYRISNPPFGSGIATNLELVYKPDINGSLHESYVTRSKGVCLYDEWFYECIPGEGNRAVYTSDGPFPTTGKGFTTAFFSSHPRDYIFLFLCIDRTKEICRNGKRVFCDGPYSIEFLTYEFPPNHVKWCAAERDLRKMFGLSFDHENNRFGLSFERCCQEPTLPQ